MPPLCSFLRKKIAFGLLKQPIIPRARHCERSEATHMPHAGPLDCRVGLRPPRKDG